MTDSPAANPLGPLALAPMPPFPQDVLSQQLRWWSTSESSCLRDTGRLSPSRQLWPKDSPSACGNFLRTALQVETAYPIFLSSPSSFKDVKAAWTSVDSPCLLTLPSSRFFFYKLSPAPSTPKKSHAHLISSWRLLLGGLK